ncbi:hypothetical protein BROC_00242 [Candidatus Brocadiaceae bacterium]|nr:hypothetical protein BROC_00242 [Candidatus Brocadiaceae bacterium]
MQKNATIKPPEGENEWNLLDARTREALRIRHAMSPSLSRRTQPRRAGCGQLHQGR